MMLKPVLVWLQSRWLAAVANRQPNTICTARRRRPLRRGGQLEVLQWLMQLPPPAPAAAADAAQAAAEAGGAAEAVVAVGAEAEAAEAGAAPALAAAGAAAAGDGAEAAAPAAAGGGAPTRASGRGRSAAPPHPGAKYVTVDLINAAMEGGNLQLLQFVLVSDRDMGGWPGWRAPHRSGTVGLWLVRHRPEPWSGAWCGGVALRREGCQLPPCGPTTPAPPARSNRLSKSNPSAPAVRT